MAKKDKKEVSFEEYLKSKKGKEMSKKLVEKFSLPKIKPDPHTDIKLGVERNILLEKMTKELRDPLIKSLTKETFYLTLVLGIVTISSFLYDNITEIQQKQQILASIGILWLSLFTKLLGYSIESETWKNISYLLMGVSIFIQLVTIVNLFSIGFFAVPNANTTLPNP